MSSAVQLLDTAGRRRSPAALSVFHAGTAPGNKGQRFAADPPTVGEIIAVMRHAAHARYGNRLDGLIVVLWRAGLGINEALSLIETDLEEPRGSVLVRHGKNDRRRQVGMDAWGWSSLHAWLAERATRPVGLLLCVIAGPTRGYAWSASAAGSSYTGRRSRRASGGALSRISFAVRMLSSCCVRGSRCR